MVIDLEYLTDCFWLFDYYFYRVSPTRVSCLIKHQMIVSCLIVLIVLDSKYLFIDLHVDFDASTCQI